MNVGNCSVFDRAVFFAVSNYAYKKFRKGFYEGISGCDEISDNKKSKSFLKDLL